MNSFRFLSQSFIKTVFFTCNKQYLNEKSFYTGAILNKRVSRRRDRVPQPDLKDSNFDEVSSQTRDVRNHSAKFNHNTIDLTNVQLDSEGYPIEQEELEDSSELENPAESSNRKKVEKQDPLPFRFVRLQANDPQLRETMMIVKSKKLRTKSNMIMLEGKRLIQDALNTGVKPLSFFFSRAKDIAEINLPSGDNAVPVYKVLYKELKVWSDVSTCPGVIGIFDIPCPNVLSPPDESMPLTIICDNIRDPGNLGSILRVAAGAGSSKVILTKGCCDMWDTKVLRSAAGAHFRIPIVTKVEWTEMQKHVSGSTHVFIADNKKSFEIGSTASSGLERAEDSEDEEEDQKDWNKQNLSNFNILKNSEDKALVNMFSESCPYFDVNYVEKSPIVIIIGGETCGISLEAFRFARFQKSCSRLNIPLFNSVESLNSGIALSVISFEMQRQFILSNRFNDDESVSDDEFEKNCKN